MNLRLTRVYLRSIIAAAYYTRPASEIRRNFNCPTTDLPGTNSTFWTTTKKRPTIVRIVGSYILVWYGCIEFNYFSSVIFRTRNVIKTNSVTFLNANLRNGRNWSKLETKYLSIATTRVIYTLHTITERALSKVILKKKNVLRVRTLRTFREVVKCPNATDPNDEPVQSVLSFTAERSTCTGRLNLDFLERRPTYTFFYLHHFRKLK